MIFLLVRFFKLFLLVRFAVVGVMEQFELSIAMMEAILPRFGDTCLNKMKKKLSSVFGIFIVVSICPGGFEERGKLLIQVSSVILIHLHVAGDNIQGIEEFVVALVHLCGPL